MHHGLMRAPSKYRPFPTSIVAIDPLVYISLIGAFNCNAQIKRPRILPPYEPKWGLRGYLEVHY